MNSVDIMLMFDHHHEVPFNIDAMLPHRSDIVAESIPKSSPTSANHPLRVLRYASNDDDEPDKEHANIE
jgi:hypothetical protein